MFITFGIDFAVGGGVGFVVGAFTPAVGRKIKAAFVSVSKKVVAKEQAAEAALVAKIAAEVKKVA